VEQAARLLERPYRVRGRVVEGQRRGRDLGFPTANLASENEILPARGVYAARVRILADGRPGSGARFGAVVNVGRRPTFEAAGGLLAEAHLLDFEGDLYGRRIELGFACRLRDEKRFASAAELGGHIAADVAEARRRLAET